LKQEDEVVQGEFITTGKMERRWGKTHKVLSNRWRFSAWWAQAKPLILMHQEQEEL